MRVLLAVPPGVEKLEIYKVTGIRAPPLGLAYIAAVLERAGHAVKIIDSPTLGLDKSSFLSEVKTWSPDVVGFTSLTPTAYKAYEAVKMIKEYDKDLPVIMGGPHATFMYEEALSNGVDVVVRGEGEITTLELVNVIGRHGLNTEALRGVLGLAFKDGGRVVVTPDRPLIQDLDTLPPPARHLLPMEKYTVFNKPIRVAHVMASRGCPYGCVFCTTSYFWGRRYRFKSAKLVADEIEEVVNKYKANTIIFTDDELLVNKKFVCELLDEIEKRQLDITFSFGSRVDHVEKELLQRLKKLGATAIYLGVESASQETLNRVNKRITVEQAIRAFQVVKEVGMEAVGSFMLGFPWETIEDMKRTVEFAIKLNPTYAQFAIVTPYPGTPLYQEALRDGLIEDFNWENWTTLRAVMRGYRFVRREVQRMLQWAYVKFYARVSYLINMVRKKQSAIILKAFKEALSYILSR
jgi:magnesium-protoporphyrin IX monomethyl ester (oxidative) cyclase